MINPLFKISVVIALVAALGLTSCARVPQGIEPVSPFDARSYMGTWYEIARLDHKFEEGLSHVTADYSLNDDGSIRVRNMGFSNKSQKWEEAVGKAHFVKTQQTAHLKVAFQWPFYSSYIVFRLAEGNTIAYVTGNSRDYLWLLSRTPSVDPQVIADFKRTAEAEGFDLQELVLVNQQPLD